MSRDPRSRRVVLQRQIWARGVYDKITLRAFQSFPPPPPPPPQLSLTLSLPPSIPLSLSLYLLCFGGRGTDSPCTPRVGTPDSHIPDLWGWPHGACVCSHWFVSVPLSLFLSLRHTVTRVRLSLLSLSLSLSLCAILLQLTDCEGPEPQGVDAQGFFDSQGKMANYDKK